MERDRDVSYLMHSFIYKLINSNSPLNRDKWVNTLCLIILNGLEVDVCEAQMTTCTFLWINFANHTDIADN